MSDTDYLIAAGAGAVKGFFDNQKTQNDEAKVKAEQERQAQLLMLKEERQHQWEALKQKDQQAFEMSKQGNAQTFEMGKLNIQEKNKLEEGQRKRAWDVVDTADKYAQEEKMQGMKDNSALALENIKTGSATAKAATKDQEAAVSTLRKEFLRAKATREKDPFSNKEELDFDSWAQENMPELYVKAYGASGKPVSAVSTKGGDKFNSIFNSPAVQAASRTKQGANDSIEQPAPIAVSRDGVVTELPGIGNPVVRGVPQR